MQTWHHKTKIAYSCCIDYQKSLKVYICMQYRQQHTLLQLLVLNEKSVCMAMNINLSRSIESEVKKVSAISCCIFSPLKYIVRYVMDQHCYVNLDMLMIGPVLW